MLQDVCKDTQKYSIESTYKEQLVWTVYAGWVVGDKISTISHMGVQKWLASKRRLIGICHQCAMAVYLEQVIDLDAYKIPKLKILENLARKMGETHKSFLDVTDGIIIAVRMCEKLRERGLVYI